MQCCHCIDVINLNQEKAVVLITITSNFNLTFFKFTLDTVCYTNSLYYILTHTKVTFFSLGSIFDKLFQFLSIIYGNKNEQISA